MTVDTIQNLVMIIIVGGMSYLLWYIRRLMREVRAAMKDVIVLTADHQGTAELFADSVRQLAELQAKTEPS